MLLMERSMHSKNLTFYDLLSVSSSIDDNPFITIAFFESMDAPLLFLIICRIDHSNNPDL